MAASEPADPFAAPSDRIRGAGKWLVAASAAVGAALFAGSQLSSIGSLSLCTGSSWEWNAECGRLPLAMVGAVLGLVAVAYTMWQAADLMAPQGIPMDDLEAAWSAGLKLQDERAVKQPVAPSAVSDVDKRVRADVAFFLRNPAQLGANSPGDVERARIEAWEALVQARASGSDADEKKAQQKYDDKASRVATLLKTAQFAMLQDRFRTLLKRLLAAAAVAALGIGLFAWAANPPEPPPPTATLKDVTLTGADLRGADLTEADLSGADLTRANLSGATLTGATLKDVTWSSTICPDGTNSDTHDNTCLGHLTP
jgi:hypothetical protein